MTSTLAWTWVAALAVVFCLGLLWQPLTTVTILNGLLVAFYLPQEDKAILEAMDRIRARWGLRYPGE